MGYDIKISKDCFVPLDNILFYVGYNTRSVVLDVKRKRSEGIVYDMSGRSKALSVIYLTNGEVILSGTTADTIHKRISDATAQEA